jgi:3-hydroxybutyryl-CoA dehydrogenase
MAAAAGAGPEIVAVHLPRAPRTAPVVELVVPHAPAAARLVDAVAGVRARAETAGRTPLVCRGRRGLAVEALLFAHLDDAARMVGDGYASAADVDAAMTLGCGYPAGPFAMLHAIGADVVAGALADPAPLLAELAAARRAVPAR